MIFRVLVYLLALTALGYISTSPAYAQEDTQQYVREQRTIRVNGHKEIWQLVWVGKPSTVCGPDEVEMAVTCPCSGVAYGEYGKLFLVRKRGKQEIERMDLHPLFGKGDYPNYDKLRGQAYLSRWPMLDSDFDRELKDDPTLISDIKHRKAPNIMRFGDYAHDGNAAEFLIQVGTLPCGKLQFAAIGVSAKQPALHFLSTATNPEEPLIMPANAWQALLKNTGSSIVPTWVCGDHGSDIATELEVSAIKGKIQVKERELSCKDDLSTGELIKETNW